jgi:hypothetical protein
MVKIIDSSDTDFVNTISDLVNDLEELIEGEEGGERRETRTVDRDDCSVEAYAFNYSSELYEYDFPDSRADLDKVAVELGDQMSTDVWFEGGTLYVAEF